MALHDHNRIDRHGASLRVLVLRQRPHHVSPLPGLTDSGQGQMGFERSIAWREPMVNQTLLEPGGKCLELLGTVGDSDPDNLRSLEARKRAQTLQHDGEWTGSCDRFTGRDLGQGDLCRSYLPQKAQRKVQVGGLDPPHPCTGGLKALLGIDYSLVQCRGQLDGNKNLMLLGQSRNRCRRRRFNAACAARKRIPSRPASDPNISLRCNGPPESASAMNTRPTGFSGVPPAGPAIPVTPSPTSAPALSRMPAAMASATSALTAP